MRVPTDSPRLNGLERVHSHLPLPVGTLQTNSSIITKPTLPRGHMIYLNIASAAFFVYIWANFVLEERSLWLCLGAFILSVMNVVALIAY